MIQVFNITDDNGNQYEVNSLDVLATKLKVEIERVVRTNCECTIRLHDEVNDLVHEIKVTDGGEEDDG